MNLRSLAATACVLMTALSAAACASSARDVDGSGGDCGEGGSPPSAAPGCFALDPQLYRASADLCQDGSGSGPTVVACVGTSPPPDQCGPAHRAIRPDLFFCCCDPRTDPACNFVP
jgi:hypothetical protein